MSQDTTAPTLRATQYRQLLDAAMHEASQIAGNWNERYIAALKSHGLTLSATIARSDDYPDGVSYTAPVGAPGCTPVWPAETYLVWASDRLDNSDLRALLRQATDRATGDIHSHWLPPDPIKHGLQFREGYRYTSLGDGAYLGYPSDSKPEIIKKADGPLLRCEDGTVHFLTLWEQLGLRAGFVTLEKLNDKYRRQDCQC